MAATKDVRRRALAVVLPLVLTGLLSAPATGGDLEPIQLSKDKKSFVNSRSQQPFVPWGFNYDHDTDGRLIEDYWEKEWDKVEEHFAQMKKLGANVVRVHLQFGKFVDGPDKLNGAALDRLGKLLRLAEATGLYLDVTGLGCYHKKDVPAWYDALAEKERWDAQAFFWSAIAKAGTESPAIFCYDLMNEPIAPASKSKDGDWLGPAFGGKHFVQFISRDRGDRPRPEVARQWIQRLVAAIRKHDSKHLVTVGLVDWSLDRPGITSGFVPATVAADLDFLCVHLYPEKGKVDEALETLAAFAAVGKPVIIEETFPLKCSLDEFDRFLIGSKKNARGWIGFYWGKSPDALRKSNAFADVLLLQWLEEFAKRTNEMTGRDAKTP